jgi:hypothetical protein
MQLVFSCCSKLLEPLRSFIDRASWLFALTNKRKWQNVMELIFVWYFKSERPLHVSQQFKLQVSSSQSTKSFKCHGIIIVGNLSFSFITSVIYFFIPNICGNNTACPNNKIIKCINQSEHNCIKKVVHGVFTLSTTSFGLYIGHHRVSI